MEHNATIETPVVNFEDQLYLLTDGIPPEGIDPFRLVGWLRFTEGKIHVEPTNPAAQVDLLMLGSVIGTFSAHVERVQRGDEKATQEICWLERLHRL